MSDSVTISNTGKRVFWYTHAGQDRIIPPIEETQGYWHLEKEIKVVTTKGGRKKKAYSLKAVRTDMPVAGAKHVNTIAVPPTDIDYLQTAGAKELMKKQRVNPADIVFGEVAVRRLDADLEARRQELARLSQARDEQAAKIRQELEEERRRAHEQLEAERAKVDALRAEGAELRKERDNLKKGK